MGEKLLDGQVAIVTGAGSGIGRAISLALAQSGAAVALAGRTESRLRAVEEQIRALGGVAAAFPTDIADVTQCAALVSSVVERFGRLDILVNNATATYQGDMKPANWLMDAQLGEWEQAFAVNVRAPFVLCREAIPHLSRQERGFIINIGAIGTRFCYPGMGIYAATKNAARAMMIVLSKELRDKTHIRVHIVNPGGVSTEKFMGAIEGGKVRPDLKGAKMVEPREIAEAVVFLVTRQGNGVIDEISVRREDASYYCYP